MQGPQGQQSQPNAPRFPQGHPPVPLQMPPPAGGLPQAQAAQQGGTQIAVQPPGAPGGARAGVWVPVPCSQDYSGINTAHDCLLVVMTDANTAQNLCWQREVDGNATKLTPWKLEATSLPTLQFFAYMQPGEAFLIIGLSLSTIYSTATDIASYHGKVVFFTGDCKGTRECIPVVLPPQNAFEWKKCLMLDDRTKLRDWYAKNPSAYGKLWDPLLTNGIKIEILIPQMITLPLRAAKLYQDF
jgi:hypothetical protein